MWSSPGARAGGEQVIARRGQWRRDACPGSDVAAPRGAVGGASEEAGAMWAGLVTRAGLSSEEAWAARAGPGRFGRRGALLRLPCSTSTTPRLALSACSAARATLVFR